MSSYWSAMTGTGLLLSAKEYENLMLKYLQLNFDPNADKAMINDYMETCSDITGNESPLISASCYETMKGFYPTFESFFETIEKNTDDPASITKNLIYFNRYNTDEYSGGIFYPIDTSDHEEFNGKKIPYHDVEDDSEILYTKFSTLPMDLLENKHYTSMNDIVNEFKDSVGAYLPDNFDWEKHIGYFMCAAYA